MPDNPHYDPSRELTWRRPLTPDEQAELNARLASEPQARADWEAESNLTEALRGMRDIPVPSNFTARVLQEVEREARPSRPRSTVPGLGLLLHRWLPRFAAAAVIIGVGFISWQHTRNARRSEMVRSLATVSEVSALPPDILQDFDAIQALDHAPAADEQLLTLLR